MTAFTTARDKSAWMWTVMMLVPPWIPTDLYDAAVAAVARRDPPDSLGKMRLQTLHEGRCVQTLHIGPFDDEVAVLARMHDQFMPGAGLTVTGRHHETYLSDARRVAPSNLRTILRQPVVPAVG